MNFCDYLCETYTSTTSRFLHLKKMQANLEWWYILKFCKKLRKLPKKVRTCYNKHIVLLILKLCIRLQKLCLENLFFHELPANQEKMTNQLRTTSSCVKIVGDIGKSSLRTWKRTKIQTNTVPIDPQTFVLVEKTDWSWFAMNSLR